MNIYPREIEDVLVMHPLVDDVAVIGVPNPDMGEEVKAVVQLVSGVDGTPELAEELIAFARERLTHYKCPKSVDFDPQLPRLPTGKLYKRVLRDRYWGDRGNRLRVSCRSCDDGRRRQELTAGSLNSVSVNSVFRLGRPGRHSSPGDNQCQPSRSGAFARAVCGSWPVWPACSPVTSLAPGATPGADAIELPLKCLLPST